MAYRKKRYKCLWCDHEFHAWVDYVQGIVNPLIPGSKGKKQACSTQVVCPNCQRTIPTWEKREIMGKMVRIR